MAVIFLCPEQDHMKYSFPKVVEFLAHESLFLKVLVLACEMLVFSKVISAAFTATVLYSVLDCFS